MRESEYMMRVEVRTQAEMEAAIRAGDTPICIEGSFVLLAGMSVEARGSSHVVARGSSYVEASGCSHVEAWESSHVVASGHSHVVASGSSRVEARESSCVEAWGSSHVVARESSCVEASGYSRVEARESSCVEASGYSRVEARESSCVEAWGSSHVVARESSHVVARESSHVEASGSSHVYVWGHSHVVARESSRVEAWGAAIVRVFACKTVTASATVTVVIHGCNEQVAGGIQIEPKQPGTPREWCDLYRVPVATDGTVVLFKGVDANFLSSRGGDYTPGIVPIASDWDGGSAECGGGLHFSPNPRMTLEFCPDAQHFIACPVRLADIVVHKDASYPQKVKAAGCCSACWECDLDGNRIEQPASTLAQEKTA